MTLEEALPHFNSAYDLCKQLNITYSNVVRWKKQNFIPLRQQMKINNILNLDLPIDMDKESMEERLKDKKG